MWKDPIVAEVRKAREKYAAKFNFDLDLIFADLQRRDKLRKRAEAAKVRRKSKAKRRSSQA